MNMNMIKFDLTYKRGASAVTIVDYYSTMYELLGDLKNKLLILGVDFPTTGLSSLVIKEIQGEYWRCLGYIQSGNNYYHENINVYESVMDRLAAINELIEMFKQRRF